MGKINSKKIVQYIGIVMLLFIIQQLASRLGGIVASIFTYELIDVDNVFAWITVHHIVQMIIAIIIISIVRLIYRADFGFRIGDYKTGLRYVMLFSFIFSIYTVGGYVISYYNNMLVDYTFPLNCQNVIGTLSFQLLLSGTSEEILFRALPISLMVLVMGKSICVKVGKLDITLETLIAALLFSIAHINWTLFPLTLSYNGFQVIYALILGVIYGKTYQKSGSVLYPMIMHGISNVVMVGAGYLFSML